MKKILVFLIVFLLLGMNTITKDISYIAKHPGCGDGLAFAANVMTADVYYFTIADTIAPFIESITPASGATVDPAGFEMVIVVKDNQTGVAPTGIQVTKDGIILPAVLTVVPGGYKATIQIPALPWGKRVDLHLEASDNAE